MLETMLFMLKEMAISILISSPITKNVPEPGYDMCQTTGTPV
jgi:hypothetical protein